MSTLEVVDPATEEAFATVADAGRAVEVVGHEAERAAGVAAERRNG